MRAIGAEPLEMLGYIAANDLPYTDYVRGNWTIANELLAEIWPLHDARPPVGVLATNSMWWHYGSTEPIMNRGRANAITRILLCQDFLTRPLTFRDDVVLSDFDAITTNPSCINCHSILDPLASHLFGFWWYERAVLQDNAWYHPEREAIWADWTTVEPAYYGQPSEGLRDLGELIASDPRYPECFVERTTELLLRRPLDVGDTAALTAHREAFLQDDLTIRAMLRSIVSHPTYRATVAESSGAVFAKLTSAELLASQVEDLTGFRWTWDGWDMMLSQVEGFYNLAGGVDGDFVTESAREPTATLLAVQQRLAEAAAAHVVEHDRADASDAYLLGAVDWGAAEADPAVLGAMTRRVLGRAEVDAAEVDALVGLWDGVYALDGDAVAAWTATVTVLLRDPDLLVY